MTIDDKIAVMQAFKEGKTVEFRPIAQIGWKICADPTWNFYENSYRIASKQHKKLMPHWPAMLIKPDGTYRITDDIYTSVDKAAKYWGKEHVVRLAIEYPPILLEVDV